MSIVQIMDEDDHRVDVNPDGSINVNINGSLANQITLLNAVVSATKGTYTLNGEKTVVIRISGTSASRTIAFKCTYDDDVEESIQGYKRPDLITNGTSTTGTAETWEFDVTGCKTFITDLTTVAGGNVSIKGRAVA